MWFYIFWVACTIWRQRWFLSDIQWSKKRKDKAKGFTSKRPHTVAVGNVNCCSQFHIIRHLMFAFSPLVLFSFHSKLIPRTFLKQTQSLVIARFRAATVFGFTDVHGLWLDGYHLSSINCYRLLLFFFYPNKFFSSGSHHCCIQLWLPKSYYSNLVSQHRNYYLVFAKQHSLYWQCQGGEMA